LTVSKNINEQKLIASVIKNMDNLITLHQRKSLVV